MLKMHLLYGTFSAYQQRNTGWECIQATSRDLKQHFQWVPGFNQVKEEKVSITHASSVRRFDHQIGRSVVTVTVICALRWPRQRLLSLSFPPLECPAVSRYCGGFLKRQTQFFLQV